MNRLEEKYIQSLVHTGPKYYITVGGLGLIIAWALYAYIHQLLYGLSVTGMNTPTYWGFYIVNFVFFVGLSAGGVIVASLVHAFNIQKFKSVARIAELLAISCLILATIFIALDLGRPDRLWHLFVYGRLNSPLVWDVIVITIYMLVSLAYGYFGARADLTKCMEAIPQKRWLFRLLALGYTSASEEAFQRDRKILRGLAIIALPLAVALHSVTAWILGLLKARPGWHSALLGPLFVISATVSGLALVSLAVVLGRKLMKLEIKDEVVKALGGLLFLAIPILGYFLFAELITVTYAREPAAFGIFQEMISGHFAPTFWFNLVLGLLVPLVILAFPRARTDLGVGIASLLVVLGVLAERWNITIFSQLHAFHFLPYPHGIYNLTWVEYSLVVGVYALGILFFAICAKLFPLVEIEEESVPAEGKRAS